MRGEDSPSITPTRSPSGSPPHARGRRETAGIGRHHTRITPACAGKTPTPQQSTGWEADHPRMRGEDPRTLHAQREPGGSPPHARGRLGPSFGRRSLGRITPACAGKTRASSFPRSVSADHPRMRGEDLTFENNSSEDLGSPPHARGRHPRGTPLLRPAGITPACAGKTRRSGRTASAQPDHPRMRGEDFQEQVHGAGDRGSPPHARGRRNHLRRI